MEKVKQILGTLHEKTEQLVNENRKLKQQLSELHQELAHYRGLSEEREKSLIDLQAQSNVIYAGKQVAQKSDSEIVRSRIEELVREIDRCINLLNR